MKNSIYALIGSLLLTIGGETISMAQDSTTMIRYSFEEAWNLTYQNSHVSKQVEYLKQEKDKHIKAAKGLYFPKIGINATYTHMSDDITFDLTPVGDAITGIYGALSKYGNFSDVPNPDPATNKIVPTLPDNLSTQAVRAQLNQVLTQLSTTNWNEMIQKRNVGMVIGNLEWPIFVGGKITIANNVAKIERKEADEIGHQKQGELLTELVERYYGLCLAYQAVMVRKDVYNGMQRHLQDANKMEQQGLIANADVLHAKVYFSQSERELSKANRMRQILNQSLINTMVLDDHTVIEPTSELFYLDSIAPVTYFKEMAQAQNPLLEQVDDKRNLAEYNYKAELASYFPQVAIQGSYDFAKYDVSPFLPNWEIGLGLKWTLFDGAARYRKVSEAKLKACQVDEIRSKANSDISTMLDKLYQELNMYKEQLDQLEVTKIYAEEYLRVREKAFHEEMSNATEVVDANLALAQVRIERLQTMYNYDLTLAELCQWAGVPEEFQRMHDRLDIKKESYTKIIQ